MPLNPPVFEQVSSLRLYRLSSSSEAGVPGYWAGFLPSSGASFGQQATLRQAWNDDGGIYLFLNRTPPDLAVFLEELLAILPVISPTGALRFLWIANPDQPSGAWVTHLLMATASVRGQDLEWSVVRQAQFPVGGYSIQIDRGAALAQANPDTLGFGIALAAEAVLFIAPLGAFQPAAGSAWLPLAGPSLGAWAAMLPIASENDVDGFARLGAQLRYAAPGFGNEVQPIPMPILRLGEANITLGLSFDPLNPLVAVRTQLSFFPGGIAAGTQPAFDATLVTTLGYGTTLQPLAAGAPLWNARLLLCFNAMFTTVEAPGDSFTDYYFAPDGAFELRTKTPEHVLNRRRVKLADGDEIVDRLTLGLSGLEYVGLSSASGNVVLFQTGQPAYAPNARADTTAGEQLDAPLLTGVATTAYTTLLPPKVQDGGLTYFAQPKQAPLYSAGTDLGPGFMDYLEMAAAKLPTYSALNAATLPPGLPIGAYTGVDGSISGLARILEQAALAPARRAAIGVTPKMSPATLADPPLALTPQGLVAQLTDDRSQWSGVVVANRAGAPPVTFKPIGPKLQAALQSNEVFFVASNVEELMKTTSVSYQLTPETLKLLAPAGVPQTVVDALTKLLGGMSPPFPLFANESEFTDRIKPAASGFIDKILPIAGMLKVSLDGWIFQVSPRSWRQGESRPTIMLFKYCNRKLLDVVADASSWGWPEAAQDAKGDLKPTQKAIQDIFKATAQGAEGTPYARFYREIVDNAQWNGVLFLNAPVSVNELPAELQFATAGINTAEFYAHHVGFSVTPFDASKTPIVLGQTAVFGLIDYQDPVDLVLAATVPFAFKTLAFTARFANATLADFSARVQLMVNRLFGSELTKLQPQHGNNLILNGGYQRQNGVPAYAFTLEGENLFSTGRAALQNIEVLAVQIQTAKSTQTGGNISVDFVLSGNLRFLELANFDLFSYGRQQWFPQGEAPKDGYLRFGGLTVNMSFPLQPPSRQTFTPTEGRMSFDLKNSKTRPLSLAQNFPVRVSGFIASLNLAGPGEKPKGQRPEDLGYTSIAAPIDQALLSPPWYGLVFTLDLGTLGALAGSVGLSITMLAAWSTGTTEDDKPVFLGLQLPDAKSLGLNLPIQGVLRLGFRSFEFQASGDLNKRSYMMRLHGLALSILAWSFPPGTTDVFLFGNDLGDPKAALGWYAAYSAPEEKKKDKLTAREARQAAAASPARRLQSGRRSLPPGSGA